MSSPAISAKAKECNNVTRANVKVKVKVRVKEEDESIEKISETLGGRCEATCSRGSVPRPPQRRSVKPKCSTVTWSTVTLFTVFNDITRQL